MFGRGLILTMTCLCFGLLSSPSRAAEPGARTICQRPGPGSIVESPGALRSHDGVLNVALNYVTSLGTAHRQLFCFVTPDGLESPTLYVKPGDVLNIRLTNTTPPAPVNLGGEMAMSVGTDVCGAKAMNASSVNIHFHGTNTTPTCHSDEVIRTLVNAGQTFDYHVKIPADEPPGLYWYHPHVHGFSEKAVQGGGTGAIVVEGLEKLQPAVARLPARILLLRDQKLPAGAPAGGPSFDVSLNYVPINYPALVPAIILSSRARAELWRVVNASADTIADFRLKYDGVDQRLRIVALDGVATDSQDGGRRGKIVVATHVLVPPAGRAEFIMTNPTASVGRAAFETHHVDTGPQGDSDTTRTLAILKAPDAGRADAIPPETMPSAVAASTAPVGQRFAALEEATVTARRKLYFSETPPAKPTKFFITVDGAKPTLFNPNNPPAIVTRQGAVEEWTIENRAAEVHEFHIHQIHFKLLRRNGAILPPDQQQFFDTVNIPYWKGAGPLSQHHCPDGLPQRHHRRFCLSLPYSQP